MRRIAVIDDGVSRKVISDIAFDLDMTKIYSGVQSPSIREDSHGTICASIIKKYVPNAVIGSIKILDGETQTGFVEQLRNALDWCIENAITIVNISLGSIRSIDYQELKDYSDKTCDYGLIMIAALNNKGFVSYPASLPNVIGVKTDDLLQNDEYYMSRPCIEYADVIASSRHQLDFKTPVSNSFAAPLIAAKVWDIIEKYNSTDISKIKYYLNKYSFRENKAYNPKNYTTNDFYTCCIKPYLFPQIRSKEPGIPSVAIMCSQNYVNQILFSLCKLFCEEEYNSVLISTCITELPENVYYIPTEKLNDTVISFIESKHYSDIIILGISTEKPISLSISCDILFCIHSSGNDEKAPCFFKNISYEYMKEFDGYRDDLLEILFSEIIQQLE